MKTLALAAVILFTACSPAMAGGWYIDRDLSDPAVNAIRFAQCDDKYRYCHGKFTPYADGLPLRGQENGEDGQRAPQSTPAPSEPDTPACD